MSPLAALERRGAFRCGGCASYVRRLHTVDGVPVIVDADPRADGELEVIAWNGDWSWVAPAVVAVDDFSADVRVRRHTCGKP